MSLHPSLTHHRNINPFENKVWEIYIFVKKCVRSFIEFRKLCLCFRLYLYVCIQQCCLEQTWKPHPTKQLLYGHLPPISKIIQIRKRMVEKARANSQASFFLFIFLNLAHEDAFVGRPALKTKSDNREKSRKILLWVLYSKVKKATTTKEKKETDIKFQEVVSFDFLTQTKEW